MRTTLILCVFFAFTCCKPTKKALEVKNHTQISSTNCIENASCVLSLIPNKTIEYKTDEFGNVSHEIIDGTKTLFAFTLTKNPIENAEDSFYKEMIFAELDSTLTEITVSNEALQSIKLYLGRFCYCKGETGFFPIKHGSFSISNITQNSATFNVEFTLDEIPHISKKINETITINE